jgi:uncharacterized protein YecE (DUF72 family)
MTRYHIGTAGWSYEDWNGIVYPETKPRGFHPLIFLAAFINIIEVNSTFYRPPSPFIAASWLRRIEAFPDFLLTVKLHQAFTHKGPEFSAGDADVFKTGIAPLRAGGRLAAVLVQFPWSFANTAASRDHLSRIFELFAGYPLAVEVRHGSWDVPEFYAMLSEHQAVFCNIDQPLYKNSIKPSAVATNPQLAYVRLHGRNYQNWFRKDAGRDDRYDYLYTKDEVAEWTERIRKLGASGGKVLVVTNNHYRGQALANALQIKNMLSGEKVEIPELLLRTYPELEEIVAKIERGQKNLFAESESRAGTKDHE